MALASLLCLLCASLGLFSLPQLVMSVMLCVCGPECTYMPVHVEVRGQSWMASARSCPPSLFKTFFHWSWLIRLGWLASKSQGFSCLHLPIAGMTCTVTTPGFLYGFWVSNSDSPGDVVGTLSTEPHNVLVPFQWCLFFLDFLFLNRTGSSDSDPASLATSLPELHPSHTMIKESPAVCCGPLPCWPWALTLT